MPELIQLSAACRGSQYRDIVPVCGGSAERVVDTSRSSAEKREDRRGERATSGGERGTNLAVPSFPRQVTR